MEAHEINIEMKVSPIADNSKDYGQGLFRSDIWRKAKRCNQPFLFVRKIDENMILLVIDRNDLDGEWFDVSEVRKYEVNEYCF